MGRPRLFPQATQQQLKCDVKRSPRELGYPFLRWIGTRIRDHLLKIAHLIFKKVPCLKTIYNYLHHLRLKRLKPRKRYVKADSQVITAFKTTHRQFIQMLPANEAVVYLDECTIQYRTSLAYMWAEKGKPEEREIIDSDQWINQNIIGATDPKHDWHLAQYIPTGNVQTLLRFVTMLDTFYQTHHFVKLHIVLDNARFHHARKVTQFEKRHKQTLHFIFIPPYAPELMPEEKIWLHLRQEVIHNQYFETKERWRTEIRQFLSQLKEPGHGVTQWCGYYLEKSFDK